MEIYPFNCQAGGSGCSSNKNGDCLALYQLCITLMLKHISAFVVLFFGLFFFVSGLPYLGHHYLMCPSFRIKTVCVLKWLTPSHLLTVVI